MNKTTMENDDAEGERRVCDADGERGWKTKMLMENDDAEGAVAR
jgi:SH3-like domain-containing protein